MVEAAVGILTLKTNLPRPPADLLLAPLVGARAITANRGFLAD